MFLSILVDLIYAIFCMVFICPLVSTSSSPLTNPLEIVPRAPIKIGFTVTFMSHSFFSSLARSKYWSHFSLSFNPTLWSAGTAKSTLQQLLSFVYWPSQGQVVWPRLGDLFVYQNPWELCASHSSGRILRSVFTISCYGQISVSSTIPGGSLSSPSRVKF